MLTTLVRARVDHNKMLTMITQLLLLKWLSFWFIWMMNPLQIPDQELVSIHRYAELRDITVTGDGWEELSEVSQRVMLRCASGPQSSGGRQRDAQLWSCVSEVASALQALEVGLLQDAVDLQVGHWVRNTGRLWGLANAEGTAGARNTLTGAAPSGMFRTTDTAAALAVGWLKCRSRNERSASWIWTSQSTITWTDKSPRTEGKQRLLLCAMIARCELFKDSIQELTESPKTCCLDI